MKHKFSLSYVALSYIAVSSGLSCLIVMPLHANTVSNIYSGPASPEFQTATNYAEATYNVSNNRPNSPSRPWNFTPERHSLHLPTFGFQNPFYFKTDSSDVPGPNYTVQYAPISSSNTSLHQSRNVKTKGVYLGSSPQRRPVIHYAPSNALQRAANTSFPYNPNGIANYTYRDPNAPLAGSFGYDYWNKYKTRVKRKMGFFDPGKMYPTEALLPTSIPTQIFDTYGKLLSQYCNSSSSLNQQQINTIGITERAHPGITQAAISLMSHQLPTLTESTRSIISHRLSEVLATAYLTSSLPPHRVITPQQVQEFLKTQKTERGNDQISFSYAKKVGAREILPAPSPSPTSTKKKKPKHLKTPNRPLRHPNTPPSRTPTTTLQTSPKHPKPGPRATDRREKTIPGSFRYELKD